MISKDFDLLDTATEPGFVNKKPRAEVVTAADLLPSVLGKIERREPPVRWRVDDKPWGRFWFEPGKLLVVGGPTGGAKTALMMFAAFGALQRNPSLRITVANVEDSVEDLLLRGIASETRIPIDQLRDREGDELSPERMEQVRQTLAAVGPRLQFVRRPFSVERAIASTGDFQADVVIFDYLQELRLEDHDTDAQDNVRRIMPKLRALADKGVCVVVTAALSREGMRHIGTRSGKHDFNEFDAMIFRDGSQIEHSMDEGFCLIPERGAVIVKKPGEPYTPIPTLLYHIKPRGGQREHVQLSFDGRYQSFAVMDSGTAKDTPGRTGRGSKIASRPPQSAGGETGTKKVGGSHDHWLK
jgi:replicative DNA helicase